MLIFINEILLSFSSCFSRNAAFHWCCTVILGVMICQDSLGITSVIRALGLKHSLYHSLEHFFHADSWDWAKDYYIHCLVDTYYIHAYEETYGASHFMHNILLYGYDTQHQIFYAADCFAGLGICCMS